MSRNKVASEQCHANGVETTVATRSAPRAICLSSQKRKIAWTVFFVMITILIGATVALTVNNGGTEIQATQSGETSTATGRTAITPVTTITKSTGKSPAQETLTTATAVFTAVSPIESITATITSTAAETFTTSRPTATTTTGSGFDLVDRRFLLTMTNQSPHAFDLIEADKWYGHLDTPHQYLAAGNETYTSVLDIRGYRSTQIGTGVTYALCFRVDDSRGQDTGSRLNIYLQIGVWESNYFGWSLRDEAVCDEAKAWYNKKHFDRVKGNCTDGVLNKGGTLSLSASCKSMKMEMLTDNRPTSSPKLTIEAEYAA